MDIPVGVHIDGKIALLKPGVLMTWNKNWVPEEMKNWTIIEVADDFDMPEDFQNTRKQRFNTEYVSKWLSHWVGYPDDSVFDVNVLSIDENTVTAQENEALLKWKHMALNHLLELPNIFGTVDSLLTSDTRRRL